MNKLFALFCLICFIICALIFPYYPVTAQDQIQISVTNSSAVMNFPLSLKFSSQIKSSASIADVRIRYSIDQISIANVISEVRIPVNPANAINVDWLLDMRKLGGLPPGSRINFWWLVKDAIGRTLESTPTKFLIEDARYDWKTLTRDKISLNWYSGDDGFAQTLMNTAQESLSKLTEDTGITPNITVDVYIYGNSNDLQGSMIHPQEWTGGVAFTPFSIIAIGISPGQLEWGKSALTHELTHVVIYQVVFNPFNDIPVWLNEGLAMYSEGALSPQYSTPLKDAVTQDNLLSVRTLCSPFSAFTDRSLLSYAESFSIVDFLIFTYGSEKMTNLLNAFRQGSTFDGAFQLVYGFDLDGLNNIWKNWIKTQYAK
jgi:hypothetical protein